MVWKGPDVSWRVLEGLRVLNCPERFGSVFKVMEGSCWGLNSYDGSGWVWNQGCTKPGILVTGLPANQEFGSQHGWLGQRPSQPYCLAMLAGRAASHLDYLARQPFKKLPGSQPVQKGACSVWPGWIPTSHFKAQLACSELNQTIIRTFKKHLFIYISCLFCEFMLLSVKTTKIMWLTLDTHNYSTKNK